MTFFPIPRCTNTHERGQAMLLTVTVLSSVILGAASLAAVLVTYQLRQVTDSRVSAQAIFATDSGIERALFERFGRTNPKPCPASSGSWQTVDSWSISSNFLDIPTTIDVVVRCRSMSGGTAEQWFAVGRSSDTRVARAMEILFTKL